ncbi:MAG: DMT family transporter [Acidimicrobiales bacterium]
MLTLVFAVLAAVANACSSVLQRKANRAEPDERSLSFALIVDLVQRPVWLGGIGAVTAGFLLQAAALGKGQIAVVEPVLVLELPFTLVLAAIVFRARLHQREWLSAGAMTLGVILLIYSLSPSGGKAANASDLGWGIGIGASVIVIGGLVAAGRRRQGGHRAALLGVATGIGFGLTAALINAMTAAFAHGFLAIFSTWQTYGMIIAGALSMFLLQSALQAGSLVAAQPGITLSDPIVAIVWGAVLFGEHVRSGLWLLGVLAGAVLIGWGTYELSHSPLVSGGSDGGGGDGDGLSGEGLPGEGLSGEGLSGDGEAGVLLGDGGTGGGEAAVLLGEGETHVLLGDGDPRVPRRAT